MNAYELMIKTNHYLIKGGKLSEKHKRNIANGLLLAKCKEVPVMKCDNDYSYIRKMYPTFLIPPSEYGVRIKTIFNQTPKTYIFSGNMYELEILRLLYILAPENDEVKYMVDKTLQRLKGTCFGYMDDGVGECFDTSLVVLRFIGTVAPGERAWIQSRIDNYNNHADDKKRPWFSQWYFWLCLSELPLDIADAEIQKYKPVILNWLCNKSCVMHSEHDIMVHPVLFSMLRNILARYPEYEYIRDREPYVSDKDSRLHFDMTIAQ